MLSKKPLESKKAVFILVILWLIGSLIAYKYYTKGYQAFNVDLSDHSRPFAIFGFTFLILRLIHYTVGSYRKNLPPHTFTEFLLYIMFFPLFLAGPIERFQQFHAQPSSAGGSGIDRDGINYGLFRLLLGLTKKTIICGLLIRIFQPVSENLYLCPKFLIVLFIYGLGYFVYMDFSGYTDIAIGISRLLGYKIPENFNNPLFRENIALFWKNWHITLYSWIRDYFFIPFFGYRNTAWRIHAGIFFSFIIFMMLHHVSLNLFLMGIYHGLGLSIWLFFQKLKKKYGHIEQIFSKKHFGFLSSFITVHFVSFSVIFLLPDFNKTVLVMRRLFGN